MKKTILLFILLLTFISCKALEVNSQEKEAILKHEVTYTNKGTKSEGTVGKLKYNDKYIPTIFSYITDSVNSYIFVANKTLWGQHQYFPMSEKIYISVSEKEITKEELNKGFYLGNFKLINTPNSWIKVYWAGESAFIDINRIFDVLKEKPFVDLPDYADNNFIYNGPMIIKN